MDLRIIPHDGERVESGPVQFGDDWPGLFLRGDMAGPLSMYLKDVLDSAEDGVRPHPIHMGYAREIVRMLGSCDVRKLAADSPGGEG